MKANRHTVIVFCALLALGLATAQPSKKKLSAGGAHTLDNSRTAAMASARQSSASDPFGFLKGSDQHGKSKDCGCPGTKKGQRQRKKEYRNHRKRK